MKRAGDLGAGHAGEGDQIHPDRRAGLGWFGSTTAQVVAGTVGCVDTEFGMAISLLFTVTASGVLLATDPASTADESAALDPTHIGSVGGLIVRYYESL